MKDKVKDLEVLIKRQTELGYLMELSFPTKEAFQDFFDKDPYKSELEEYGLNQKKIRELKWYLKSNNEKKEHRMDMIKFEEKHGIERKDKNLLKYMNDYLSILEAIDNLIENPVIHREFAKYLNDIKNELQKADFVGINS